MTESLELDADRVTVKIIILGGQNLMCDTTLYL